MKISSVSKSLIVFLALTSLVLTACNKIDLDTEFILKIGEKKVINSTLSFKIEDLTDSRCPANANCISAGDVTLYFNIEHSKDHIEKVVSFNENRLNPFSYRGYLWKIMEVNPYPMNLETLDPMDFTIKMIISKD
jgi:hypothetical protein